MSDDRNVVQKSIRSFSEIAIAGSFRAAGSLMRLVPALLVSAVALAALAGCATTPPTATGESITAERPPIADGDAAAAGAPARPAQSATAPERAESAASGGSDDRDRAVSGESAAGAGTNGVAGTASGAAADAFPGSRSAAVRRLGAAQTYIRHRELHISQLVTQMSLEEKVGQMLMPALSYGPDGKPATRVHEGVAATIRELQPGGVILFGPNVTSVEQTVALTEELQRLSRMPLFVAIDEEGGEVSRLNAGATLGATETPAARIVGALGDPELAYRIGVIIGRELRSLGVNMNLAPVADVLTNPSNTVIGRRAYGEDPTTVAQMVAETVRGLQSSNIASVIKHFPGHGDTVTDSHTEAVSVEHGLERLRRVELVPFEAGINAGVDGVMTGHISVPRVTGNDRPATISPTLLQGVLREELRFEGLVVSDSMSMKAVSARFPDSELAVEAVKAGVDIVLKPQDPRAARDALLRAVRSGQIAERRVDDSVQRILRVKLDRRIMELPEYLEVRPAPKPPEPASEVLGAPEHRRVVDGVRARYNGESAP